MKTIFYGFALLIAFAFIVAAFSLSFTIVSNNERVLKSLQHLKMDRARNSPNTISVVNSIEDSEIEFRNIASSDTIQIMPILNDTTIQLSLKEQNVSSMTYGSADDSVSMQVNEFGLVNSISEQTRSGIKTLGGTSDQDVLLLEGRNIHIKDTVIQLASNITVESLDVMGQLRFSGITPPTCASPLLSSCIELSSTNKCTSPLSSECVPKIVEVRTVNASVVSADNVVALQVLSNQTELTTEHAMIGETHIRGNVDCNGVDDGIVLPAQCVDLAGFQCNVPLNQSLLPQEATFQTLGITNTLTVNGNLVQCSASLPSSCLQLDGLQCPDGTLDNSCLDTMIVTSINGNTNSAATLTTGPLLEINTVSNGLVLSTTAEANTAMNVGSSGRGFFLQKIASELQFKTMASQENGPLTINSAADSIAVSLKEKIAPVSGSYTYPIVEIDTYGLITNVIVPDSVNKPVISLGTGLPIVNASTSTAFLFNTLRAGSSGSFSVTGSAGAVSIGLIPTVTAGLYGADTPAEVLRKENRSPQLTVNGAGKIQTVSNGFLHTGGGSNYFHLVSGSATPGQLVTGSARSYCRLSGPEPSVYGNCLAQSWNGTHYTVQETARYRIIVAGHARIRVNGASRCHLGVQLFKNQQPLTMPLSTGAPFTGVPRGGEGTQIIAPLQAGDVLYAQVLSRDSSSDCNARQTGWTMFSFN